MKTASLLPWIILPWIAGCGVAPYARVEGPVFAKLSVERAELDDSGLRVPVVVDCWTMLVEHWCPPEHRSCRPEPDVTKYRPATCPEALIPEEVSIHAPWGKDYRAAVLLREDAATNHAPSTARQSYVGDTPALPTTPNIFTGVLTAQIDWKMVGQGLKSPSSVGTMIKGWSIASSDQKLQTTLELTSAEIEKLGSMLARIFASPKAPPAAQDQGRTELTVALSSESDAKGTNRVYVTVTNRGPSPAYKVAAQLKSSSKLIHGQQLTADRVDPGKTEKLVKRLGAIPDNADLEPMVKVDVSAANAPPITTSARLRLAVTKTLPAPLLSCAAVEKFAAPEQKIRVQCTASNPGDTPMQVRSVEVAVDKNAAIPAEGAALPELAPHGNVPFEVTPTMPKTVGAGALPVMVTLNVTDYLPVQQSITIRIVPPGGCTQNKLTWDQYQQKHRRLQDLYKAGSLSQEEYDKLDSELLACLE